MNQPLPYFVFVAGVAAAVACVVALFSWHIAETPNCATWPVSSFRRRNILCGILRSEAY